MIEFTTPACWRCGKASKVLLEKAKLDRWRAGALVQNVWPEKSLEERELIMTGVQPECWAAMFPEEEGDDDGTTFCEVCKKFVEPEHSVHA